MDAQRVATAGLLPKVNRAVLQVDPDQTPTLPDRIAVLTKQCENLQEAQLITSAIKTISDECANSLPPGGAKCVDKAFEFLSSVAISPTATQLLSGMKDCITVAEGKIPTNWQALIVGNQKQKLTKECFDETRHNLISDTSGECDVLVASLSDSCQKIAQVKATLLPQQLLSDLSATDTRVSKLKMYCGSVQAAAMVMISAFTNR